MHARCKHRSEALHFPAFEEPTHGRVDLGLFPEGAEKALGAEGLHLETSCPWDAGVPCLSSKPAIPPHARSIFELVASPAEPAEIIGIPVDTANRIQSEGG